MILGVCEVRVGGKVGTGCLSVAAGLGVAALELQCED